MCESHAVQYWWVQLAAAIPFSFPLLFQGLCSHAVTTGLDSVFNHTLAEKPSFSGLLCYSAPLTAFLWLRPCTWHSDNRVSMTVLWWHHCYWLDSQFFLGHIYTNETIRGICSNNACSAVYGSVTAQFSESSLKPFGATEVKLLKLKKFGGNSAMGACRDHEQLFWPPLYISRRSNEEPFHWTPPAVIVLVTSTIRHMSS